MSARAELEEIKQRISSENFNITTLGTLKHLVAEALRAHAPKGEPYMIDSRAGDYRIASTPIEGLRSQLRALSAKRIPEIWVGMAATQASDLTNALSNGTDTIAKVYSEIREELKTLAIKIREAKLLHREGVAVLNECSEKLNLISGFDLSAVESIKTSVLAGLDKLIKGANTAEDAGKHAARKFSDLAYRARAHRIQSHHLTSADKLVIAQASAPGGIIENNAILSSSEAARAGQNLDRLNENDRKRFDSLLDNAKSPQERAYLMKALAAGHNIDALEKFGKLIHPYGHDARWLSEHLTPVWPNNSVYTSTDATDVKYGNKAWTQGNFPTCVASSTVFARAMVDPLYALELTTGGKPDDPQYSSSESFAARLFIEQVKVYGEHRWAVADIPVIGYDGMRYYEGRAAANAEISPYTGSSHEHKEFDTYQEKRSATADITKTVDQGKPVPAQITVTRSDGSEYDHQILIIAHENDRFQIYDPHGHTRWISADEFSNGYQNSAGGKSIFRSAHLPK